MRKLISFILLLIPFLSQGQTDTLSTAEVVILPEFTYGTHSLFIKANEDNTFQYSILDMDNNKTLLIGNVSSLEPLVKTGKYTFNTPNGTPYASGFYSNNIPFRLWNYFDEQGQVSAALNFSVAIQFMKNYGDIDIGEDFVYEAKKEPKFGRKGIDGFASFIKENAVYPPFPLINKEEGTVLCQFVIDKTGQLINVRIVEGVNEDFDLEVIRLLSLSPVWKPGQIKGEPVNFMYQLRIHFKQAAH